MRPEPRGRVAHKAFRDLQEQLDLRERPARSAQPDPREHPALSDRRGLREQQVPAVPRGSKVFLALLVQREQPEPPAPPVPKD